MKAQSIVELIETLEKRFPGWHVWIERNCRAKKEEWRNALRIKIQMKKRKFRAIAVIRGDAVVKCDDIEKVLERKLQKQNLPKNAENFIEKENV